MATCKCPASTLQSNGDILLKELDKVLKKYRGVLPKLPTRKLTKISRELVLCLGDLHWGFTNDKEEFGEWESSLLHQKRRLGKVVLTTCHYKMDHRKETGLNILGLGDWMEGQLLHGQPAEPLSQQFVDLMITCVKMLHVFSDNFIRVNIYAVAGNHDRNKLTHKDRALTAKWDGYMWMLMHAIKQACSGLKNVKFIIPKTPYIHMKLFNWNYYATHADTHFRLGNPASSINMKEIAAQMNAINSSDRHGGVKYDVFIGGHVHVPAVITPTTAVLVINGPLSPPGGFAESLGASGRCGQYLFEVTEEAALGDHRLIHLDHKTDKDNRYDFLL